MKAEAGAAGVPLARPRAMPLTGAAVERGGEHRLAADPTLVARVAARLERRRDAMVADMVGEMHRMVPGYWRLRGSRMDADLRSAAIAVCDMFIAVLAERRSLSVQEERMLRTIGARRARQGIGIEMLRGAAYAASRVGWRHIVASCVELGSSPAILATMGAIGDELAEFVGVTLRVLASAYHSAQATPTERSDLLAEALSGPVPCGDAAGVVAAERLERALGCAHALLLVSAVDPAADAGSTLTRAAVAELLSLFPNAVEVPLTSAVTGHATVAVPVSSPGWSRRAALLQQVTEIHSVHVFVAAPAARIASLRGAYQRATALLRVARAVNAAPAVVRSADLRLCSLLIEGLDDHESYIEEVLGPILRLSPQQRDRLLETLVAFRASSLKGGLRAAAKMLGVHEKTVAYRTERIIELTGLDPDVPHHRAQLIVAVDLLALQGVDRAPGVVPAC